jgi:hypothetical protein
MSRTKNSTSSKSAALAPVAEPVIDSHSELIAAARAFVDDHFPRAIATAIVVSPGVGLPPIVIPLGSDGCVPNNIAPDDTVRVG